MGFKAVVSHLDFGHYLDDALWDRLVSGLNSDVVQCRLLSEKNLNRSKVFGIAVAMDLASKNTMGFSI